MYQFVRIKKKKMLIDRKIEIYRIQKADLQNRNFNI